MSIELALKTMSAAEKVELLEVVWQSLSSQPHDVRSPAWHQQVLEARRQNLDAGQTAISPWSEAKARLMKVGR